MSSTRLLYWFKNATNKFVKNNLEDWEKSYQSGYWDLLNAKDQLGRHYAISGLLHHHLKGVSDILDVGCGFGTLFPHIKNSVSSYVGVDPSKTAILQCQQSFKEHENAHFSCATFEEFPLGKKFDVVIYNEILYYLPLNRTQFFFDKTISLLKEPKSFAVISMTQNPKAKFIRWKYLPKNLSFESINISHSALGTHWVIQAFTKEVLEKLRSFYWAGASG